LYRTPEKVIINSRQTTKPGHRYPRRHYGWQTSQWETIFKDAMTAAAIDRLVHHCVIVELNISSYRVEQAKKAKGGRGPEEPGPKP
jgi:hypothetical protein